MSSLTLQILNILEDKLFDIRPSSQGDLYQQLGKTRLIQQIQTFIENNEPIELLLPGFPCKSPNLDKVSGKLPDAGEFLAMIFLNNICREISFIYKNGCRLRIWSDGRVFEDLI